MSSSDLRVIVIWLLLEARDMQMPCALIIIDGAGLASLADPGNAVIPSALPNLFHYMADHGYAVLEASGTGIGLDNGQSGNSEIGHMTIGAGFTVPSNLQRIDMAYSSGLLASHPALQRIGRSRVAHVIGLVSDAGTHGHYRTIMRLARLARDAGTHRVVLHLVLDGIDSPRGSAPGFVRAITNDISRVPGVSLGTVIGRQWFCDRSGNFDVTRVFLNAVRGCEDLPIFTESSLVEHLFTAGESSFPPHRSGTSLPYIDEGTPVFFAANRADRATQAAVLLSKTNDVFALVELGDAVPEENVFLPTKPLRHGLYFVLGKAGVRTKRIAESCKFPHVTQFFDGFNPTSPADTWCIASPAEADLALHPEMRASEIAAQVVSEIAQGTSQLIVANIANLDQIGHLGRIDLALEAAKHVDIAIRQIADECKRCGWTLILVSDHGNADCVIDEDGRSFGSHTVNPVPLIIIPPSSNKSRWVSRFGTLANVAPTVLTCMGIPVPGYMDEPLISPP